MVKDLDKGGISDVADLRTPYDKVDSDYGHAWD